MVVVAAEGQIPKMELARNFYKWDVLLSLPRVPNDVPSAFDILAEREQNLLPVSGFVRTRAWALSPSGCWQSAVRGAVWVLVEWEHIWW